MMFYRFCEASLLEFDILTKLEKNKYTEAFSITVYTTDLLYNLFILGQLVILFNTTDLLCNLFILSQLVILLEKNKYTEAFSIYEEAVKQYDKLTQDKQVIE
jgi:hypothetical protein